LPLLAQVRRRNPTAGTNKVRIASLVVGKSTLTPVFTIPPTILRDPDDDAVLAAALGGQAQLIVSGDRDLLDLRQFRSIPIVSVNAALDVIR